MWKESYRTGIERIDYQHKMLFDKSTELLEAIEKGAGSYEFQEMISFLKGYTVFHFRHEEEYQRSVGYTGYEAHKKAHEAFTDVVLDYERRLGESNFDLAVVKELAGVLTSWLIYHVCHSDQRMVQGRGEEHSRTGRSHVQIVTDAASDTLRTVAGLEDGEIRELDAVATAVEGGLQVGIDLFGDLNGTLIYTYSEEVAVNLFQRMASVKAETVDEMVRSAMAELANISSGSATIRLGYRGLACDIKPPRFSGLDPAAQHEGVVLDTGLGRLKVSARLDRY